MLSYLKNFSKKRDSRGEKEVERGTVSALHPLRYPLILKTSLRFGGILVCWEWGTLWQCVNGFWVEKFSTDDALPQATKAMANRLEPYQRLEKERIVVHIGHS